MEREVVKIADLKAAPYNPRRISKEAADGLTKSLERWGVVQEVVANKRTGHIVGGHQRVAALRKMGVKEVPVVWVDLDDVEEKALNVALNNPHIAGEFDDTIAGLLTEIRDGIGPDDFAELKLDDLLPPEAEVVEGKTDPDDVPEVPEDPITKPGDLWILGNHRLLCGDSTNIQHVERLMGGEKADMVFTDPPYGIGYEYSDHKDDDNEANAKLVYDVFSIHDCGKVWTPGLMNLARDIERFGKTKVAVWHKKFAAAGNGIGGASTWEPILILNPQNRGLKNDVIVLPTERETVSGKSLRDLHSCPKPVSLYVELISSMSSSRALIFEPFCGSGTTLIACEKTDRRCFSVEMSPSYCDVIVKRWEEFTGKKAVLEASDATG